MPSPDPSRSADETVDDGRYVLVRPLGSGVYGEVWEARDTHRDHVVALKLMDATDPEEAWDEARRLTALESPNILKINNASTVIDVPYLDTQLAQAGTLAAAAGPRGMPPARAVLLTRGVLRGLELTHQHRILHRDIKLSNLFLTDTGDAQLADFGVAAPMDAAGTAPVHGDPNIRPPEAFAGGPSSIRSDIYAMGLSLYALLTGGLPFDFWSDGDLDRHGREVTEGPQDIRDAAPHIGRGLAGVIRKAIAQDPDERWQSAAAFDIALSRLREVSADVQPVAPHPGHDYCWEVTRRKDAHRHHVCLEPASKGQQVHVRHAKSGATAKASVVVTNRARKLVCLRKVFTSLT